MLVDRRSKMCVDVFVFVCVFVLICARVYESRVCVRLHICLSVCLLACLRRSDDDKKIYSIRDCMKM